MSPTVVEPPLASDHYSIHQRPQSPAPLPGLELPLIVLLAVPISTASSLQAFNVPEAIAHFLGRFGSRAMQRIMQPRVWIPDWTDEQIATFASAWTAAGGAPHEIRVGQLPTVIPGVPPAGIPGSARIDVLHFVGSVVDWAGPSLALGTTVMPALQATDLLAGLRTRLLILQLDAITPATQPFVDTIVALGGPPVLVAAGQNIGAVAAYFRHLYANLLHNMPLSKAAEPEPNEPGGLQVMLTLGQGADGLLQFHSAIADLMTRLQRVYQESAQRTTDSSALRDKAGRRLHAVQADALRSGLEACTVQLDQAASVVERQQKTLAELGTRPWNHEYEGVVPLQEAAANVQSIETTVGRVSAALQQISDQESHEEARAPRVLNTNFALPDGGVLLPRDGLIEGSEYDLLLDVGPKWTTIPSLVDKGGEFPEDTLPPDAIGYQIDVTVISEDFTPHMASGSMWLPRGSGRSSPMINGSPAAKTGPIALRMQTPKIGTQSDVLIARARLCLYYENNLLQSAVLQASVVKGPTVVLSEANVVRVDFALTKTFADVEPSFARRAVKLAPDDTTALHPINVSLVLNNDGDRHRFIVRRRLDGDALPASTCPPEAWTPYDPIAGIQLLDDARARLADCFYVRDGKGVVQSRNGKPVVGLDGNNAKSYQQFQWDLLQLARVGMLLFNRAFSNVQADNSACNPAQWRQALRLLLREASIIQIARTATSEYVFPWALVYDYPLIDAERGAWKMCQVLEREWSPSGRRQGPPQKQCPFDGADWHQRNIVCPYGFWGLRHVIEEPPSVEQPLGSVANGVLRGNVLNIGVAAINDPDLSVGIKDHLKNLRGIAGVAFNPDKEAGDFSSLQTMLKSPEIAYFLCHGEYDPATRTTYLRLGSGNRVSPDDLLNWSRLQPPDGPDVQSWKERHPFIFINGCHTSALKPGEIVSFVGCFSGLQAGGVLGTEISVLFPVAAEVAEFMFSQLAASNSPPVGEALRAVRWQLANKGNLLGLAYTLYGLADLRVVMEGGLPATP